MKLRVFGVFLLALLAWSPAGAQVLPMPPGWQMERAVLLSRHGVRSPIKSNEELDRDVATPWPTWPVPPGYLTPRGAELLQLMGRYYRVLYGGRGLVQTDDCPERGTVAVWTDVDERTKASGAALLAGMYPRCPGVGSYSGSNSAVADPLFHPSPTASCPMDGEANRAAVLERIGGDFSSILRDYAPELSLMQATLCPAALAAGRKDCGLSSEPSAVRVLDNGWVRLAGPVAIGSNASENFLLEYAEGMPPGQVAWGRLSGEAQIQELLKIHRLEFDLSQKTLPIARQRGTNLLAQITDTLADGHKFPGLPRISQPVRFALLVGHDTNLANVSRLLNLHWQIPGYQANEYSPGGALAFELLKEDRTGRRYVRLAYYAQTPYQMRERTVLDLAQPPGMVAVDLPACNAYQREGACPLESFIEIAKSSIEPGCVTIRP
jgi:4-phytase/acid phosphatase